ncbi:MAG: alcohol dehydrogenase catalytic domain-containing protein [Deltaproteobacteria bacterium]|jgi:(R,R)-butanediol dehydrogenase/meso-butanediol dehydrogenase/diacetyl reductase|nr:alcohol dehydrogenase catalytic domain-containing protein [Deltaproteobacteria bacterium]
MKAAVYRQEKGLVVEDVPMPELDDDGVLVSVANTGFCGSDHSMIANGIAPDGYILGHETSGVIAEVGKKARDCKPGTRVIIRPTYCGTCPDCKTGKPYFCPNNRRTIGVGDLAGAFAEYIKVYPQMVIPVPEGVDSQNAALAEAFAAALHGIKISRMEKGSALVIGGGPIGLGLVRLLRIIGFAPVVLSEPLAEKRAIAESFGADGVIDPFNEDLGACVFNATGGVGFETVFECSGVSDAIQTAMDAAARSGTVCVVSMNFGQINIAPTTLNFKELRLTGSYSNTHEENIQCLRWMQEGKLDGRALITDLIGLDELPRIYTERIHSGKAIKVMLQIGDEF